MMTKFIKKILCITTPFIILIVSINYFVDTGNLFGKEYIKKMMAIYKAGKNITNISNYDERLFQEAVVKTFSTAPEVLVLGSSRTMLIKSSYYPANSFYNSSVSGASLEDLVSIFQLYFNRQLIPHKIILGIDPWIFNQHNGQTRWLSLRKQYNEFFCDKAPIAINPVPFVDSKLEQLFSLSYFQACIKSIFEIYKNGKAPVPTSQLYNNAQTKLLDGSIVYDNNFRNASSSELDKRVNNYVKGEIYSLSNFTHLSPTSIQLFDALITRMKKENIEVIFFLAPYHPSIYPIIVSKCPMINEVYKFINDYAKQQSIEVLGAYDPNIVHLDKTEFYDGMHCTEKGISKILKNYNQ